MCQKGSSTFQKCISNMRRATARGWNEPKKIVDRKNRTWTHQHIYTQIYVGWHIWTRLLHTHRTHNRSIEMRKIDRETESCVWNNSIEQLKNRYVLNKLKPKLFKMKRNEMHTKINRKTSRGAYTTKYHTHTVYVLYGGVHVADKMVFYRPKRRMRNVATMKRYETKCYQKQTHTHAHTNDMN